MGKSSSSTNKPWEGAQPYMLGGAQELGSVYQDTKGKIAQNTGLLGDMIPGAIDKYKAGDPTLSAAQGYGTDVLSGKYLNSNPYFQQSIDAANNDIRNQTNAGIGIQGLTGGSSHADILSRNIARNENDMRMGNYQFERGQQTQAAGMAPAMVMGDNQRLQGLLGLMQSQNAPMDAASNYAGSLGGLLGGYQTQTKNPSTAETAGGIGSLALGLASLFSDKRLKTDIRRVGETDAGTPIYVYRYLGEGPYFMGVMAQEIAETQPDALGPVVGGYATVYYEGVR